MIDLQAEAVREEYALRLGLPADSHPADVLQALVYMTDGDVYVSELAAITHEMGGKLHVDIVRRDPVGWPDLDDLDDDDQQLVADELRELGYIVTPPNGR